MGAILKAILLAVLAAAMAPAAPPPTTRVLAITWHHQEHNLTCEAAALRMALSYYGIAIDEQTLLGYMTLDPRPAAFDPSGRLKAWGDPALSYVGDPDGHIERYTGYGVYNSPVARAAVRAGAHVVVSGSGLYGEPVPVADVYNAVLVGHPVVAWISNTYHSVPLAHYLAFDGSTVAYTLTEHAVTVVGVRPDAVLINDPWFGPAWHPKAQFESAYATFSQMAVVIRS
ncbi:MAG TPA: C39 family peptidase [Candidatus Limnocylindrales bacterium]|nr:C39 family peptidase [Candidatus Limnocylindrales bacterium]